MEHGIIKLSATILAESGIVGSREHEGPLSSEFDEWSEDDRFDCDTWEKSESEMQRRAFTLIMKKSGLREKDIDGIFAGDLLNQCVGSSYGLMDYDIPYFGLYGACSTAAEGLMIASAMVSANQLRCAAAITSSHYCSAERQYRTPIEYGAQRSPTAQRTVTGSGAFLVGHGGGVAVTEALAGIVVEKGINDASNMGAAMAPAALSTLVRYFSENTEMRPEDFDLIVTGDLGYEGADILRILAKTEGLNLSSNYNDCGIMIFNKDEQDVHAGGSGCGCSAVVLASHILPRMRRGELSEVLFIGTGAMMSPSSIQQGLAIPAVAHLVRLSVKNI